MELWWPPHVLVDVLDSPSILACEANFLSSQVRRHHEVFFFILK